MTDLSLAAPEADPRPEKYTPAGIQPLRVLFRRRLFFAVAAGTTWMLLAWGIFLGLGLGQGRWPVAETVIFLLSLLAIPWSVIGFWNAAIGFWLLRRGRGGLMHAAPFWRFATAPIPLALRVAVVMTVRNEDPARAMARLLAVRDSLDASGEGAAFDYFILSDTSNPEIAEAEERLCAEWRNRHRGDDRLTYRRRQHNKGYKAGNVRDFLDRWGESYDVMISLDADSVMSGAAIVGLVRIMQAFPRLGILQSLVVGTPSRSAFARIFQFGMRHGMRSYTMGSAWWTGDCGPYWGHNAAVRIKPFKDACILPVLPGKPPLGGHVLSHDQIEAALMRRAGYEVRVAPVEEGSYEDNPPTLVDFTKRDLRWCQGNMQYWRFLAYPGLKLLSRFQIALAIIMYIGSTAAVLAAALALLTALFGNFHHPRIDAAITALTILYGMSFVPSLAGIADVLIAKSRDYGGRARFLAGAIIGIVFSVLLSPIVTLRSAVFTISLLFGRMVSWGGQARDAYSLNWRHAAQELWPQTAVGVATLAVIGTYLPGAFIWVLPVLAGLVLAIPFAVVTGSQRVGAALAASKLCAIPEEFETAEILQSLKQLENKKANVDKELALAG